jgi:hypothetical protein
MRRQQRKQWRHDVFRSDRSDRHVLRHHSCMFLIACILFHLWENQTSWYPCTFLEDCSLIVCSHLRLGVQRNLLLRKWVKVWHKTTILYCVVHFDPTSKTSHQHIRLATNMKFAVVNIYGHPNIWCEVQHRLTTKNFFYLELKRNRQFHKLSVSVFRRPLWPTETTMEKLCITINFSHTTYIIISIKLQMKYWQIKVDFEIFL